jgi:asparagine synthase (glutamine-hydrolysing)
MFRYVSFVWNALDPLATETYGALSRTVRGAPGWRAVVELPGLGVFCAGESASANVAHVLTDSTGVVLGTVFESDFAGSARHRRARIDETAARRLQRTRGRELVERYWGRYVAFIHDAEAATTWILRDPSGDLDCMMTEHRGVRIFFSLMEDCPPLDRLSFSVNWDYVAMFVSAPPSEGYQTGLREISRVLAGECMTMRRDGSSREFYWDPFDIVAAERIDNPDHAAPLLHETTVACVHAWASCYERILNLLSGGLDSSIIVGCLKTAASKPAVTNFHTYYSAGSGSDERSYARAAAELAGYAMLENEMDPDVNLQDIYTTPPTATPVSTFIELGILARRRRACAELGIRGVFRGSGGDQLFFQNGSQYVCADYIFERGVRPGLFRVALDAAYMENDVVWALLLRGLRDANSREPLNLLLGKLVVSEILAYDVREHVARQRLFLHPWFRSPRRAPPGKYWQIFGLSTPYGMSNTFGDPGDPEDVHPLLSQPLVELCLRIPTHVLASGGVDRALARRAFTAEVPRAILRRRIKGEVHLFPKVLYAKNRAFVRDLLLSGSLVNNRILDRQRIERALQDAPDASDLASPTALLLLASVEAWLELRQRQPRCAAA